MSERRVDYDAIAARYDRHRGWDERMPGLLLELAASGAGAPEAAILELGCGTGNLTRNLERLWRGPVVALDRSRGMLAQARGKLERARLLRSDAAALPFGTACFAGAVGSFFLHYLDASARARLFAALRAALVPGGGVAFLTTDHAQIRACALARWFPSLAAIDCARFPAVADLLCELEAAGFSKAQALEVEDRRGNGGSEYLEKARARFISTLDLLEHAEFEAGLRAMEAQLARDGHLGDVSWRGTVVCARAREGMPS
ncbi:MAG: class I SAM-dependent methyltransferase [Planctomycetes bacterium]|nr:class I SAM-dependent methyltransferase [Planctomycetota bacterium]